ncbi:hypothetical protein L2E82_52161 [Cichorium intybus]|nr:hypothetical protein L2E82_52161 [Cichorium intybus]
MVCIFAYDQNGYTMLGRQCCSYSTFHKTGLETGEGRLGQIDGKKLQSKPSLCPPSWFIPSPSVISTVHLHSRPSQFERTMNTCVHSPSSSSNHSLLSFSIKEVESKEFLPNLEMYVVDYLLKHHHFNRGGTQNSIPCLVAKRSVEEASTSGLGKIIIEGKLSATWPWVTTMSISVQQPSMVLLLESHLFVGNLLKGQTVGVIGAGHIGTACHMEAHHPWTRFFKKPTWRIIHKVKIWKAPMFDITKLMEDVPTGELPRNMLLSVDRHLVQTIVPGTRLTIMVYSVFQAAKSSTNHKGAVAVRQPYLRVVEEFKKFAAEGNVYENICSKIAPSIFGHENVKKAVACLLFGGSRKSLPDDVRLRGPIQFLQREASAGS